MIDRKRVREMAAMDRMSLRKSFRSALIEFLATIEPDIERMECLDVEFRLCPEERNSLDDTAIKILDHLAGYARIVEIRMRTRGRISVEMSGLIDRLERVTKAVYGYLRQRWEKDRSWLGVERDREKLRFDQIEERVFRQKSKSYPFLAYFGRDDCNDPENGGDPACH